ncbi:ABC transporter ATP-binding protein [Actinomadura sp. B10D3]|uniref:ABC transporter ATP-binding protein n=1 Tax=Actinomadura sp. B10D3 TaxID=3153557 RepID=UPI00325E630B
MTKLVKDAGAAMATAATAPVLDLRDLKVEVSNEGRWTTLVEDVDLTVGPGETVGLVGESGSGKTITSLAVMRLLPANARLTGSVRLGGRELVGLPDRELRRLRGGEMSMIFQEPRRSLNPAFSVGDQVAESVRHHDRVDRKAAWSRAVEFFERVGIPDPARRARDYPHQFSGGMCQRVMLAMALACSPSLLIADEPTTALDVTVQRQVLELIRELQEELGLGVLLITHDLGVVAEVCDRAAVMYGGRVVEHATVVDLFDKPRDDYTSRLLGARELGEPPAAPATDAESGDALVVEGLRKDFVLQRNAFGRPKRVHHAVRGVDFSIRAGETLSVVGESGAGKSTVGRMVLRLVEPDAGRIEILGQDIASLKGDDLRRMRAKATMIFQDPYKSLDPKRQIVHALAEPMLVQGGYSRSERSDRIAALMKRVGLGPRFLERYPYEMSGGQLQRVAIARALMTDPRIVVCDEPVAALDMSIRAQVVELLRELQAERGLAYLFVSHDLSLVRAISDRIVVMRQGEIVETGTPGRLYESPEHTYTRQLLSAIPATHPRGRTFRAVPAA